MGIVDGDDTDPGLEGRGRFLLEKEDESAVGFAHERSIVFLVDDIDRQFVPRFGLSVQGFATSPAIGVVSWRPFWRVVRPTARGIAFEKRIVFAWLIASHGATDATGE